MNPASGYQTDKRRAYRTVLDVLFHALVRYAVPVLVFTSEEVWTSRFGADAGSVHLAEWPVLPLRHSREGGNPETQTPPSEALDPRLRGDDEGLVDKWTRLREMREMISFWTEQLRKDILIGSSLAAQVEIGWLDQEDINWLQSVDFAEICIVSEVSVETVADGEEWNKVTPTTHHKCGRCWRHLPEVTTDGDLCNRCDDVLHDGKGA